MLTLKTEYFRRFRVFFASGVIRQHVLSLWNPYPRIKMCLYHQKTVLISFRSFLCICSCPFSKKRLCLPGSQGHRNEKAGWACSARKLSELVFCVFLNLSFRIIIRKKIPHINKRRGVVIILVYSHANLLL